jgi:hypothetical protein
MGKIDQILDEVCSINFREKLVGIFQIFCTQRRSYCAHRRDLNTHEQTIRNDMSCSRSNSTVSFYLYKNSMNIQVVRALELLPPPSLLPIQSPFY